MVDLLQNPTQTTGAGQIGDERGNLTVAPRAVEKIVVESTRKVPGVVVSEGTAASILGRSLPRAHVDLAGQRATVDVDLAVAWGTLLAPVADQVRTEVSDGLRHLAGVTPDRVSVSIRSIVYDSTPQPRSVT